MTLSDSGAITNGRGRQFRTRGISAVVALIAVFWLTASPARAQVVEWTERAANGPSPRRTHAMAYDSNRGVTVLFGGWGGSLLRDTWEWDGYEWALRSTSGPSPRDGHQLVFDAGRGVIVLFGGNNGASWYSDTWEWNGSAWTLRTSSGPSPRTHAAMAYDSARGLTVLFGGLGFNAFSDTWEWNGTTWTQRSTSGPSARDGHTMAYDSAHGVTVLFGGISYSAPGGRNGETWEWNGNAWTQRLVAGPAPRHAHAMTYDTSRGVSVLFGGDTGAGQDIWNGETWEWDGTTWSERGGAGPSGRYDPRMAFDSVRGVTVLFGGDAGSPDYENGETWELGVIEPANLSVTPAEEFAASGPIGGPFSPPAQTYTLTNLGDRDLNWTATVTQTWLSLNLSSGLLAGGASVDVHVSLNAAAGSLSAGIYNDTLVFANTSNGTGTTTRNVELEVQRCRGDIAGNGDGEVGLSDLSMLLSDFGCPADCGPSDLDGDGDVDISDLSIILSLFGSTCP